MQLFSKSKRKQLLGKWQAFLQRRNIKGRKMVSSEAIKRPPDNLASPWSTWKWQENVGWGWESQQQRGWHSSPGLCFLNVPAVCPLHFVRMYSFFSLSIPLLTLVCSLVDINPKFVWSLVKRLDLNLQDLACLSSQAFILPDQLGKQLFHSQLLAVLHLLLQRPRNVATFYIS